MTSPKIAVAIAVLLIASCAEPPVAVREPLVKRAQGASGNLVVTLPSDAIEISGDTGTAFATVPQDGAVWYRFTASAEGHYRFLACGGGLGFFDPTLELFDAGGALLADNDDTPGLCGYSGSLIDTRLTPTSANYVRVRGFPGTTGVVVFKWKRLGLTSADTVSISGAMGSVSTYLPANGSYWFAYHAPAAGTYVFSTCAADGGTADFDTFLWVVNQGYNDDDCESYRSRVVTTLIPNTYIIRMTGYNGAGGRFTLAWRREGFGQDVIPPVLTATLTPELRLSAVANQPVTVTLRAVDEPDGSGVAAIACFGSLDGAFQSSETAGATRTIVVSAEGMTTVHCTARDNAGNVTAVLNTNVRIDMTPPTVSIDEPTNGAQYRTGDVVTPRYSCADRSVMLRCIPEPSAISTSVPGRYVFRVTGTDIAGNTASTAVAYEVLPGRRLCPAVDLKPGTSGSVIPMKVRVCNDAGANVSGDSIAVRALRIVTGSGTPIDVEAAGHANPDGAFRYDPELTGYILNLRTRGLASGTYRLIVSISGTNSDSALEFHLR